MKSYNFLLGAHTRLVGGMIMQRKTEILCNVRNCVFYDQDRCHAQTISVSCDNCAMPNDCHETKCKSFRCKTKC